MPLFIRWAGIHLLCLLVLIAPAVSSAISDTNTVSLAELCNAVGQYGRTIRSFHVVGTVCAVDHSRHLLTLQDKSGGIVLEVPRLDKSIRAGDLVRVTGDQCPLTRCPFGLQLGTTPVVNNEGHHPAVLKSGKVFLSAGLQPVRVTWFNGINSSALKVEYEGPDIPHQTIPNSVLFRKPAGTGEPAVPGLDFAAYTGSFVYSEPDFENLAPVTRGIATNFDLRYSPRNENAGLIFSGYIEIPKSGTYTFYLESDDGACLFAGDPATCCQIETLEHANPPAPQRFEEQSPSRADSAWTELEAEVVFVGRHNQDLELELAGAGGERIQTIIVKGASLISANWLHQRVLAIGILDEQPDADLKPKARLIVPGPSQIGIVKSVSNSTAESSGKRILTSIGQIRHLTRAEAESGLAARIQGVVIWSSYNACVLANSTGGVYVESPNVWEQEPGVGQLWEMDGITDPGFFSPVIKVRKTKFLGTSSMPDPIRPYGDQLLNGSLDAEYVELRGALIQISDTEMTLLTAEGKVVISEQDDHPLPSLPSGGADRQSFLDSIVRIRGCVMARAYSSHSEAGGKFYISPATVEIEEKAPQNPFSLPTRSMADLLRFDPGASVLQRIKVRGQIVFGRASEYCLQDEKSGLRLLTKGQVDLKAGDLVEAVGFPQLGGPSPLLQEARVKVITNAPLPAPALLSAGDLLNRSHDSTLVQVEAMLLEDRVGRDQRILELQAGQNHFTARLNIGEQHIRPLEAGSRLRLTGVYLSASGEQGNADLDAFQLWLSDPANIEVLQTPPWWTKRRALSLVGTLTGVMCLAFVWITVLRRKVEERTAQLKVQIEERERAEQRRVMEHERTRVAQDLHDELGAGLTEMGLLGDLAKNPAVSVPEKEQYLGQLTNTARSLVSSLDEIVWAVNPHYDSVASLVSYCTLFAQRFLDLAHVACRPQIPGSFPDYPLDSKVRHGLFLAFREALNNVVRHSSATQVRLEIKLAEAELIVSVSDDGCGFDPTQESPGSDGVRGMRQRMKQIAGSCQIRSQPGAGTEVELRLPIERPLPCR